MQISNILSKLSNEDKPQDVFLALAISSELVVASLWTVVEGKTKLIKTSPGKEWEEEGELLMVVDDCLTFLLTGFARKIKGVIFGLEESWVEKNAIVSDRQPLLKQICQKLELKPLGFVVLTEALIQYLKIVEGMPLSALLIKLETTQAMVTLVKLGKIIKTESVGRSDDLSADLKEALARFGEIDSFPSRILLFDGLADFEEARQQIISYDWPQELPFLHFPKVDILEKNIVIKALAIAGGSEVAKALGFEIKEEKKSKDLAVSTIVQKPEPNETEETEEKSEQEEIETEEKSEEVIRVEENIKQKETSETTLPDLKSAGFVAEEDILEAKNVTVPEATELASDEQTSTATEKENFLPDGADKEVIKINMLAGLINTIRTKINFALPPIKPKKSLFMIVFPIIFLVLIFTAGFAFYWYVPKAEVKLHFEQKSVEQDMVITANKKISQVDIDKRILPMTMEETELSGSKTRSTSGKILVGDKAKGKIMVYNKTDIPKVLASGTTLTATGGLKYLLDSEVEIASQSSQITSEGEQIIYGKKEALIVAVKIGPEYNLKKDTEFSVDEYTKNNFSAIAIDDLSGGTSREVAAVDEEDQNTLLAELTKELTDQARTGHSPDSTGKKILSDAANTLVVEKKYDKKIGAEGDSLRLDLTLKITSYIFNTNDLKVVVAGQILSLIPENYVLQNTDIEDQKTLGQKEDELTLQVKVKATLTPKVDMTAIKEAIKGKYPTVAQEYLNTLPNFKQAEIKIYPKFFPTKLKTLPHQTHRINILIEN